MKPLKLTGPKSTSRKTQLAVRDLNPLQRQVYDAMMRGRTGSLSEARYDALLMIENATKRDFLREELEYWTSPTQLSNSSVTPVSPVLHSRHRVQERDRSELPNLRRAG